MTSSKFLGFWTPPSPCQYQIHATSLPFVRIWLTPSLPLSADVICTSPLGVKAAAVHHPLIPSLVGVAQSEKWGAGWVIHKSRTFLDSCLLHVNSLGAIYK